MMMTQRGSRFHLPYRAWLLLALLAALAVSAIRPPHSQDFVWEHMLTLLFVAGLIALEWRRFGGPLSNAACTCIFVFLMLHVIGARYTYSEVPYDHWAQRLLGVSISQLVGAASYDASGVPRNYFDRVVHLSFGLLMTRPMSELVQRWFGLRGVRCVIVAAAFLCMIGTLYELLEWLYAATMGQEAAELYNGQQGDTFDAQKDLALNITGSTIIGIIMGMRTTWRRRKQVSGAVG